jgi:hypothetical protein
MNNIIDRIIHMPVLLGNKKSIYSYLKETGYFENYNGIDEGAIAKSLNAYTNLIGEWLDWSSNKRTSEGWFFINRNNNKYTVGYFPNGHAEDKIFSDKEAGCAYFIKCEVEQVRKNHIK